MPDSMTQILSSGPTGMKVNIAVLGDGFADGTNQTLYSNKVNDLLFNGLFKNHYYFEDIQAFNVSGWGLTWIPCNASSSRP